MKFSKDEEIIFEKKPNDRLIVIWFFTKCLTHAVAVGFLLFMIFYFQWIFSHIDEDIKELPDASDLILFSILFAIVGLLLSYIYHRYLIKTITYYITDRRCIWKGGIIRKVEHSVSYYKITDVERSQNIFEQLLGISSINLFTPGTSSMRMGAAAKSQPVPELRFEGLVQSEDEAESINEQIRKFGHSMP